MRGDGRSLGLRRGDRGVVERALVGLDWVAHMWDELTADMEGSIQEFQP